VAFDIEKIIEAFSDGFQMQDAFTLILECMKAAEQLQTFNGEQKKQFALETLETVLLRVKLPWYGPILRKIILWVAPHAIDKFVEVTKGGYSF
jgi:hypothetical protein